MTQSPTKEPNPKAAAAQWGALFPDGPQIALLKAVFVPADTFGPAWRAWAEQQENLPLEPASEQLLGLLAPRIRMHNVVGHLAARCQQRYRLNRIGNMMLFHKLQHLLPALRTADVDIMLLKGAAVIPTYYRDLGLRPMSDIDLAARPEQFPRAVGVLSSMGWSPIQPIKAFDTRFEHSLTFEDRSGVSIDLHCHPIGQCLREKLDQPLWARAIPARIGDQSCLRLSEEDEIIETISHGMRWVSPPPLRWAADTMTIVGGRERPMDWDLLGKHCEALELTSTVLPCLQFLHETFGLRFPKPRLHSAWATSITARERRLRRALSSASGNGLLASMRYHRAVLGHVAGENGLTGAIRLIPDYLRSRRGNSRTVAGAVARYLMRYFLMTIGVRHRDPRRAAP